MSPEKLSPGAAARAQRDADFAARFGNGARPQAVAPKADPAAPARSRAVAIRAGLTSWAETRRLIMDARQAEDWIVLGYTSFELYCEGEFSMKSLRLTAEERQDAILAFRSAGMTVREIGAATGTSKNTAQRALKAAEVDLRVPDGTKLPQVEALRQAIEDAAVSKDSFACEDCGKKLATGIVRAAQTRCLKCDPERIHFAREVGGPCEACEADEAATLVAGTQSPPAADASTTLPHAGVPAGGDQNEERTEAEHEQDSAWHGGPGECGVGCSCGASFDGFNSVDEATDELALHIANPEERIEEEAAEPPADLPAAATTSLPDGDGDPMPEQSQQPGQDSPPVLGSEGFPGRAETDHHRAGVSGGGHAPRDSSLVELEEFEDDDDTAMTSSSSGDPRDEHTPTDLLLMTFDALINLIDHLDAEAVGPLLFPAELEQLHGHVDALAAFVARVSKARFEAMQRTS